MGVSGICIAYTLRARVFAGHPVDGDHVESPRADVRPPGLPDLRVPRRVRLVDDDGDDHRIELAARVARRHEETFVLRERRDDERRAYGARAIAVPNRRTERVEPDHLALGRADLRE